MVNGQDEFRQQQQQAQPAQPAQGPGGQVLPAVAGAAAARQVSKFIPSASEIIPGPVGPQSVFPGDAFTTSAAIEPPAVVGAQATTGAPGVEFATEQFPGIFGTTNAAGQTVIPASAAVPEGFTAIGTDVSGGTIIAPAEAGAGGIGNIVAPIALAHGAYQLASDFGERDPKGGAIAGAQIGGGVGFFFGGPGVGAAIGATVGGLIGNIKTGKHIDQKNRDRFRSGLQELGLIDEDHRVQFSDGSVFDMGKDGGARLINHDGQGNRPFYDADPTSPFGHQAVGWVNPLAVTLARGNVKLANDFAGYFANAVMTDSQSLEEVRLKVVELYQQAGISTKEMLEALNALRKEGKITNEELAAFAVGLDTVFKPGTGQELSIEEFLVQEVPGGVADRAPDQQVGAFTPTAPEEQPVAEVPIEGETVVEGPADQTTEGIVAR